MKDRERDLDSKLFAEGPGKARHLVPGKGALLVDPVKDLGRPIRRLTTGLQTSGQFNQGQAANIFYHKLLLTSDREFANLAKFGVTLLDQRIEGQRLETLDLLEDRFF